GCLAVIPGSHDRVHPFDLVENPGQAHRRVARLREVDPSRAVYMELRSGPIVGRARRDPPRLHADGRAAVGGTGIWPARPWPRPVRALRARARAVYRLRGERARPPADPDGVPGEHPDGPARARRAARLSRPPARGSVKPAVRPRPAVTRTGVQRRGTPR